MKKNELGRVWQVTIGLLLMALALFASPVLAQQRDDPENIPPPDSVTIAGSFQTELGCAGTWNTSCPESMLTYDEANDIWLGVFDLPAGDFEYKAALNETWDDNYGLNAEYYGANIPISVPEDGPVTFWYHHNTRWVSDSVNSVLAAVVGDFQEALGCPANDDAACLLGLLTDPDGDGRLTFITADIPPGDYAAQVAHNQNGDELFGSEGDPVPFTAEADMAVVFLYDPAANTLEISSGDLALLSSGSGAAAQEGLPAPALATQPDLVVVPGTIQSVLGCEGDWLPDCEATALVFDEEDGLWTNTFTIPAGEYEYKVAIDGTWDVNFGVGAEPGGANIPLVLEEEQDVTFLFSTQTGWVADSVNSVIANVPGDFQSEIGCPGDWAPDCLRSWLQDPDGDGVLVFQTESIPAGVYEAKVAVGQSWDENYGEGGDADGANIPFEVPADGTLVTFAWDSGSKIMNIGVGAGEGPSGNIREQRAHWVSRDTIAWDIEPNPEHTYRFHYSPTGGGLSLAADGISGGEALTLTYDPNGLPEDVVAKFPHLANFAAFKLPADEVRTGRIALKGQTAISASDDLGALTDATGLQIPGVVDDWYTYDGPLGVTWEDGVPTLRVWAPTAQRVRLIRYADADPASEPEETTIMRVDPDTGVWSITGEPGWDRSFYEYEVRVFAPSTGAVETNLVTDPYSFSLSQNSGRSQIVNLDDADLKPAGWDELAKPPLAAPEDSVIYELHVRDFSIYDETVPEELRGTYSAFTTESDGMQHLAALAEAGVTHLHLLPSFDIATINENAAERVEPDRDELAALPPDSDEQQAIISAIRDQDGFNWGYDPFHYTVPEGSYSTDPDGVARILEYPPDGPGAQRDGPARGHGCGLQPHQRQRARRQLGARPDRARLLPPADQQRPRRDLHLLPEHGHRTQHDAQADGRLGADVGGAVQDRRLPLRPDGPPHDGRHAGRARRLLERASTRPSTSTAKGWDFGEVAGNIARRQRHAGQYGRHRHRRLQRPAARRRARRQPVRRPAGAGLRHRPLHRPERGGGTAAGRATGAPAQLRRPDPRRAGRQSGRLRVHRRDRRDGHRRGRRLQRLARRLHGRSAGEYRLRLHARQRDAVRRGPVQSAAAAARWTSGCGCRTWASASSCSARACPSSRRATTCCAPSRSTATATTPATGSTPSTGAAR